MSHQARLNAWAPLFATPPATIDYEKLGFYHTMEIPGLGRRVGQWDVGPVLQKYLGQVEYRGRFVLDIGTANGAVAFALEQRGATVVSVDLPTDATYDLFPGPGMAAVQAEMREGIPSIRNAFWLAHRTFNSQVRLVETHVTAIPAELTGFDVVFVGNVLQHLRFPVDVLLDLATRADTVVVTEAEWLGLDPQKPLLQLYTPQLRKGQMASWYQCSPQLVEDVLTLSGMRIVSRDWFSQPFTPIPGGPTTRARLFTITAQRQ
jgi:Methyltransferase domain